MRRRRDDRRGFGLLILEHALAAPARQIAENSAVDDASLDRIHVGLAAGAMICVIGHEIIPRDASSW